MNGDELAIHHRIATFMESLKGDRARSQQLFQYVWTMVCVRRGLMRVIGEDHANGSSRLLVETVKTGRRRLVYRPTDLDTEIEGLAVQALARILTEPRHRA